MPTTARIKSNKTEPGDIGNYSGTIHMLDYMTQKSITLNCIIHVKSCKPQGHTALLIEISPKPPSLTTWTEMHRITDRFKYYN